MKVYVDKLPEMCADCPCLDEEVDCQLLSSEDMDWKGVNRKHTKCPLQSLTDHDKQVRKEVCEEIWKEFETRLMNKTEDMPVMKVANMINSVLDKVKGETK